MMLSADYIVDMGPLAGRLGGEVVFQGTPAEMLKTNTLTSAYINKTKQITPPQEYREGNHLFLSLYGASGNNLKNVSVKFPLGKFICITGVSGSGKSSLINGTLYPILSQHFYRSLQKPLPYQNIEGIEIVNLTHKDVVRHPLVTEIVKAYTISEEKSQKETKNESDR
jgi:excinuclease ABC subunit A